jgi:hypothetical protein
MRDQKLDEYHDLAIENNDFAVVDGLEEMVQAVRIAFLTVQREYWLNWKVGVPWNHGMFQPWMSQAEKELHLKRTALSVEGVTSADLTYSIDRENRAVLSEVSLETLEGKITRPGV